MSADVWEGLSPPYSTIVADPPWHYEGFVRARGRYGKVAGSAAMAGTRAVPLPYNSLSVAEIEALPVGDLAAPDSFLFLWTTNRYLPASFGVMGQWGFGYRQTIVWRKTGTPSPFGGSVAPNHAEFLLLGAKGSPRVQAREPSTVVDAPKQAVHSLKPAAFLDFVERVSPGPYVELFARAPRLGWDSWGHGYETERVS